MRAWSKLPPMLTLAAVSLACCAMHARRRRRKHGELYEKAKREQTLVLYGAGPTGSHDRWIREFQQRYSRRDGDASPAA